MGDGSRAVKGEQAQAGRQAGRQQGRKRDDTVFCLERSMYLHTHYNMGRGESSGRQKRERDRERERERGAGTNWRRLNRGCGRPGWAGPGPGGPTTVHACAIAPLAPPSQEPAQRLSTLAGSMHTVCMGMLYYIVGTRYIHGQVPMYYVSSWIACWSATGGVAKFRGG